MVKNPRINIIINSQVSKSKYMKKSVNKLRETKLNNSTFIRNKWKNQQNKEEKVKWINSELRRRIHKLALKPISQ